MDEKKDVNKETPEESSKKEKNSEEKILEKKKLPEIILPILPSDNDSLDAEMSEIFEEDSVKHQHGGTEPESD